MPLLTSQFINDVLVADIRTMQKHGLLYLSIVPISAGIELLGALLRTHEPIEEDRHGKQRFNCAISTLFPPEYKRLIDRKPDMYSGLRCWGIHQIRPRGYGVLSAAEAELRSIKHLGEESGFVVLICETFFIHFEQACSEVVKRLRSGDISDEPFLWLPGDVLAAKTSGSRDCGGAMPASGVPFSPPK